MLSMYTPEKIRALREELRYSRGFLACCAGVSASMLRKRERRYGTWSEGAVLEALARILGVPTSELTR